ncbi:MAG: rod shape-determining protein MreC [Patescibacteria group bacterium]
MLVFFFALNLVPGVRSSVYRVFSPVHALFWETTGRFGLGAGELREEATRLREENLSLQRSVVELQSAARENEELREALSLQSEREWKLVGGSVFGKAIGEEILLVELGAGSGLVPEEAPVVTAEGVVVGRVEEQTGRFLRVRLLSHRESAVNVNIAVVGVSGVLKGMGGGRLSLELVPGEAELSEGSIVSTSVLGGAFPENLLIGRVGRVERSDVEAFQQAEVESFFSLQKDIFIFVLLNQ